MSALPLKAIPSAIRDYVAYDPLSGALIRIRARYRHLIGANAARVTGSRSLHLWVFFDGENYAAHRVAWFLHYGSNADGQIDHINGNGHDNRIANLRLATPSQNSANKRNPRKASGLPRGVVLKPYGRYQAAIGSRRKWYHLGTFATAEEAHNAYLEAASRLHKEFARHQ